MRGGACELLATAAPSTLTVLKARTALHEAKLSPGTCRRLRASTYAVVLLDGRVPCWASPDALVPDGAVVVHEWILRHLGLAEGKELLVHVAEPLLPKWAAPLSLPQDGGNDPQGRGAAGPHQR